MKTIWAVLLLALSAHAATYTVRAGGGGDYTTIQACANAMKNGDTCTVYAGMYNEHVTVPAGGVGAYKTLLVNGGDLVYVYDFTVNSHNKIVGFHIQNPSSPASNDCIAIVNDSTDVYITNNSFYACGYHAMISGSSAAATSTYVYIQNNTLSYGCSTSSSPNVCKGIHNVGDYHLVENNDISHVSDGMDINGSHNVIRNNTMHDTNVSDCGAHSSNCHIDFVESESSIATQYNLIERNTEINNIGQNGHGYLSQGDYCSGQCYNLIIRFNVGAHVGGGGILDNTGFPYVKSYNNTWVDYNQYAGNHTSGGITSNFTASSTNGAVINDLFYYPESLSGFWPYSTDSTTNATFSSASNLAWCTGATCDFRAGLYSANGLFTADAPGNRVADPKFANYTGSDFSLSAGSPAVGSGTYLTTVGAGDSGSGTSLVVNDASFFQDGLGMTGVRADCIAVRTVASHVCVTAINYQANTLTLAASVTRSPGDAVWLYSDSTGRTVLIGSAPNIGAAFATTASGPIPPTVVTAVTR